MSSALSKTSNNLLTRNLRTISAGALFVSVSLASPLSLSGCKENRGESSALSTNTVVQTKASLLELLRDGRKKLYLDQALSLAQTFKQPTAHHGEGCRDLQ